MKSKLNELRNQNNDAAIVFIHGFMGDAEKTWGEFPNFIIETKEHKNWDIFSLGYPTSLSYDLKGVWRADPDIKTISDELRTKLSDTSLSGYKSVALIAHSMGGLVVQRALIDLKQNSEEIFNRISHTFLLGTPSDGLEKVSILSFIKRQLKNMGKNSDFIKDLRKNRVVLYTSSLFFRAIAGDEDEFVTRDSSIYPFPDKYRKVVPGDHLSMVKPDSVKNDSVQIVLKGLSNKNFPNFWDSAKIAVEERNYYNIIKEWEPHSSELDDKALVQLALAMDEVGRRDDAIKIIFERKDKTTDAMGVLAGRFKRQWLYEGRKKSDAERAIELYSKAYDISRKEKVDADQALYNGINVAFMQLVYNGDRDLAKKTAQEVLIFCKRKKGKPDKWSLATEGEVYLLSGDIEASLNKYQEAIKPEYGAKAWQIGTMYRQARRIIEEFNDSKTAKRLDDLFSGETY